MNAKLVRDILRETTPEERMRQQSKRPTVYVGRQISIVTKKPMTAVNWIMVDPEPMADSGSTIVNGWMEEKDAATGFVSWDDLSKVTGLSVLQLASKIKSVHKSDPTAVSFSVNRMGDNTYVRINNKKAFNPT
jgi:hypothetical protein